VAAAAEAVDMVTMNAKWGGKCKVCGRALPPGTLIEWTKEEGARHVSPEACAEAALPVAERVLRPAQPESAVDRARCVELLLGHPWKAAKHARYKKLPHEYTLRKHWLNDDDFVWCVEHMREVGYEVFFLGRTWIYYDFGPHHYWDYGTGDPRSTDPKIRTILINRALVVPSTQEPDPKLF
jgi:hypothetical protein